MLEFTVVDAFAGAPFEGNPAAVVVLPGEPGSPWPDDKPLQLLAREMNLSETAYLRKEGDNTFQLRWFTPNGEVDLCGHATLASAAELFHSKQASREAVFLTRSGKLRATEVANGEIQLDFPEELMEAKPTPDNMAQVLRCDASQIVGCAANRMDFMVEIKDEEVLLKLDPDTALVKEIETRCLLVTCKSTDEAYDFKSRVFAPRYGITEDPVTGSAHCGLGPYWAAKLCKSKLVARQASARGGDLGITVDREAGRVFLRGKGQRISKGKLLVPIE